MEIEPAKYPRTMHLEDSGLPGNGKDRLAWASVAGRNVVFEEKIDGSHSGFFFDGGGNLHALSRGSPLDLSARGGRDRHFDAFKDWLSAHEDMVLDRIEDRYVVYGEWAYAAHAVYYDRLPHPFVEFDVMDRRTGEWLSTPRRRELLQGLAIASVPVLYEGRAQFSRPPSSFVRPSLFKSASWRTSLSLAASRAGCGTVDWIEDSDLGEGIYGKVEEDGQVTLRFKWVREGFVRHIVEGRRHWQSRAILPNGTGFPSPVPSEAACR